MIPVCSTAQSQHPNVCESHLMEYKSMFSNVTNRSPYLLGILTSLSSLFINAVIDYYYQQTVNSTNL